MAKMSDEEYQKAKQEFETQKDISFEALKSIAFSPSNAESLTDTVMTAYGLTRDKRGVDSKGMLRYHSQKGNGAVSVNVSSGLYYDFRPSGIGQGSVFDRYFEQMGIEPDRKLERILSLVPIDAAKEHYEKFIAPMAFDKWLNEEKGFVTHALYQLQQGNIPDSAPTALQKRWETALSVTPEETEKRNLLYAKSQEFHRTFHEEPTVPFSMEKVLPEKQVETFAYLTQIRGLKQDMIQNLMKQGKIMTYFYQGENSNGNTYLKEKKMGFPMQNSSGEIVGMDARPLYHETGKKSIVETGSPSKTSFVEFQCGKCDENAKVLIFEAAIDALSYMEMYAQKLNNIRLISTQGANNIDGAMAAIEGYHTKPHNIFVCADNDRAGHAMFQALQEQYQIPDRNRLIPPEGKKDWNSYLCSVKGIDEGLKKTADSYLAEIYERWFRREKDLFPKEKEYQYQKPVISTAVPEEEAEKVGKEIPEYRISAKTREKMHNNPNVQIAVNHMRETAQAVSELMLEYHTDTYSKFNEQTFPSFPNIFYQEHYHSGISLTDNGVKLQLEMSPQAIRESKTEFSGFSAYCFQSRDNHTVTENQQILLNAMATAGLLNENDVRNFLENAVIIPSLDDYGKEKPVKVQFGRSEMPEVTPESIQEILFKAKETQKAYENAIKEFQQITAILKQMQDNPDYEAEVSFLYQEMEMLSNTGETIAPDRQQKLEIKAYHYLSGSEGSFQTAIRKLDTRIQNGEIKLQDLNQQCGELQTELEKMQIRQNIYQENKTAS